MKHDDLLNISKSKISYDLQLVATPSAYDKDTEISFT